MTIKPLAVATAVAVTATIAVAFASQQAGGQWDAPPAMQLEEGKDYRATIVTNMGEITLDLFEEDAPGTVNNFVFLANENYYDGVIFHRVIDGFMIQGGDPTGTGRGGPGYTIKDEVRGNPNRHEPFTLSMAKTAAPDSGGSQFFITEVATPHLDGIHTVFGTVLEGRDVVEAISDVRVGAGSRPVEDVVIQDVVITADGEPTTRPE
jgi:peptidyl-prolyl cis-trans isomerase B (cyclophilin B)